MNEADHALYSAINDRITDLQKSYRTLNDCHRELEKEFVELKTTVKTVVSIVKFFVTPGIALILVAEVLSLTGVV